MFDKLVCPKSRYGSGVKIKLVSFVGKWIKVLIKARIGVLRFNCSHRAWSAGDWCVSKPRPSEFAAQSGSSISERWVDSAPLLKPNKNKLRRIPESHTERGLRARLLAPVLKWMEILPGTENGHLLCWGKQQLIHIQWNPPERLNPDCWCERGKRYNKTE